MPLNNKTTVTLSSGFQMPMIGFGTSFSTTSSSPNGTEVEKAVEFALRHGYRHLDCAPVYENEAAVGRGIKSSGIPRSDIFITSKLWNTEHAPEDVETALDKTLRDLDTEYLDLFLIHWPSSWVKKEPFTFYPEDADGNMMTNSIPITETWAAMEALLETGKVRSIGVSNFSQAKIEEVLSVARIPPAVNQLQVHPYRPRKDQLEYFKSKNIHITAWGPLTIDREKSLSVNDDAKLVDIAKSLNISPAQLALSWAIHRGISVIPNSSKKERISENFEIVELLPQVFNRVENLC